eukprot:358437-Chlamydomonas_euryale.AAC.2
MGDRGGDRLGGRMGDRIGDRMADRMAEEERGASATPPMRANASWLAAAEESIRDRNSSGGGTLPGILRVAAFTDEQSLTPERRLGVDGQPLDWWLARLHGQPLTGGWPGFTASLQQVPDY